MNAFDEPDGAAVLAPQRDFAAGHHPFAADLVDEIAALLGILIELARGLLHQLLARGEAEDAGHRVVAIEDAAVDRVAVDARQIALEQDAMALLAPAQRGLGAMTLDGVDEDLAADAQQRHRLLGPRVRNAARDAERAEKFAVVNHRHDHDRVIAGAQECLALGRGFRR